MTTPDFNRIITLFLLIASLTAGSLALPAAAAAAPKLPDAPSGSFEVPAGEYCEFAVRISYRDGQRVHENPGAIVLTGPFVTTVTNLASGEDITLNAPGPLLDGPVSAGPWLIGQPASRGVGEPFLIYHRGRVTFNDDNTVASIHGRTIDLCAVLS